MATVEQGMINSAIRDPASGQLIPPTPLTYNEVDPASSATVTSPTVTSQGYDAQTATAGGYEAATGTAEQAEATTREVTPEETMQHQLAGIIDSNSPLIQRARARAMETMNARGLQNSSMAIGAADAALYDVAMPIAQFDANVYGQAARDNQSFLNQVAMFNVGQSNQMTAANMAAVNQALAFTADAENRASMFNADAQNTAAAFSADAANKAALAQADMDLRAGLYNATAYNDILKSNMALSFEAARFNADTDAKIFLQTLEGDIAAQLANIEANNKAALQASASAAASFQQGMSSIASIIQNPDLTPEAKDAAVKMQLQLIDESLKITGAVAELNLADLFAWEQVGETPPAANVENKPAPGAPGTVPDKTARVVGSGPNGTVMPWDGTVMPWNSDPSGGSGP